MLSNGQTKNKMCKG